MSVAKYDSSGAFIWEGIYIDSGQGVPLGIDVEMEMYILLVVIMKEMVRLMHMQHVLTHLEHYVGQNCTLLVGGVGIDQVI
jgi:hypothetical protein